MKIAELFINIALTGTTATQKALGAVHGGLKEIGSASLATKAAVLGVVFGFERMSEFAAQTGADLVKFEASTGLATKSLQELQHVGRKYDVSASEIEQTIRNIQKLQTEFNVTGAMPSTAGLLGIDLGSGDAFQIFEKLARAAKGLHADQAAFVTAPFGISPNVLQMTRRMNFELDKMGAHVSSDRERAGLAAINRGWNQFYESLQNISMKVTANYGLPVIDTLRHSLGGLIKVTKAVNSLGKEFTMLKPILAGLAILIAAAFSPITAVAAAITLILADYDKFSKNQPSLIGDIQGWANKVNSGPKPKNPEWLTGIKDAVDVAIGMKPMPAAAAAAGPVTEVTQYFDVSRDEAPAASVDELTRAVQKANFTRPGVKRSF